jgi:succinate dehydrogenase / fumarate reductase cytochrome b subunit
MAQLNRPLSPHLSVYRWEVSNTLSILHRATGVMLSFGALVFTIWLVGIAAGPDTYLGVVGWLRSPLGVLLLFAGTFCFFYHLCNGIRHLFWDAGFGFEMPRARATGIAAVAGAVLLTAIFWLVALTSSGGNS